MMSNATLARACPMWHRSYTVTPHTYMRTLPGTRGTNGSFRFPIVLNTESVIPPHLRRFPGASPGAGPPPRRRALRPPPRVRKDRAAGDPEGLFPAGRKMETDIAVSHRPVDRVGHGMQENVPVGVTEEPRRVVGPPPPQPQFPPGNEAVGVPRES